MITFEEQLHQLTILAKISHNDKLCSNNGSLEIYRPSSVRSVYRWWMNETRAANIAVVRQLVFSATQSVTLRLERMKVLNVVSDEYKEQSQQTRRMVEALAACKEGLHKLLQTYSDDCTTTTALSRVVSHVEDFLERCPVLCASPTLQPSSTEAAIPSESLLTS